MAQDQQRGCPPRALGTGCFLAEEAPFTLTLGQFLEECWWGEPRSRKSRVDPGNSSQLRS